MSESPREKDSLQSGPGPEPIPGNRELEEKSNNSAQISADEPGDDYQAPDLSAGAQTEEED